MTALTDLGLKLLSKILVELSIHELMLFKRISKDFNNLVSHSPDINYRIKLEMSGLLDNPSALCTMPVAERTKYLHQREQAWDLFRSKVTVELAAPHGQMSPLSSHSTVDPICDVSASQIFLGLMSEDDESASEEDDDDTMGVAQTRLPSVFNELGEGGWSWNCMSRLKFPVIGFASSVEENDLIAFAIYDLDEDDDAANIIVLLFRSSTQELHDAARASSFRVGRTHVSLGRPKVNMAISGENLAVVIISKDPRYSSDDNDNTMRLYDWKLSKPKCSIFKVVETPLIFLTNELLLTANSKRGSLDIYQIPTSAEIALNPPPPPPEEYNPLQSVPEYMPPLRVRVIHGLQLPPLAPGWSITSMKAYCDPAPTADGEFPKATPPGRPYAYEPLSALMILTMTVAEDADPSNVKSFQMAVHRFSLIYCLPYQKLVEFKVVAERLRRRKATMNDDDVAQSLSLSGDHQTFATSVYYVFQSWDEWGPPLTRWFDVTDFSHRFKAVVSGQRYVQYEIVEAAEEDDEDTNTRISGTIHVLDFESWTTKRAWKELKGSTIFRDTVCSMSVVGMESKYEDIPEGLEAEENICPGDGVFADKLVGRLPYVRCTRNKEADYDGVMITEQSLVGMKLHEGSDRVESVSVIFFG